MTRRRFVPFALALLAASLAVEAASDGRPAPLFDDLGDHHASVTTVSVEAQRYFDQGLVLNYGFNHAEAVRSFRAAQRLDPACAMCFWGEAMALGPNINKPMDPADAPAARAAIDRALALAAQVTPRERALIEAMSLRYAVPAPADRSALDAAFANAMAGVAARYPNDLDTVTLYAEALMDLMPWDYYDADGRAKPRTDDVVAVLEGVLARNPDHPGAIHLYIHIVEPSSTPARAEAGADRLADLVPGSGHLVHMPSHIYLRVGRYKDATAINERAAAADESYIEQCRAQGFYPALYYPHNLHFLWYTASLEGRSEAAIAAARKLADNVPAGLIGDIPLIEQFLAVPQYGLIRFARWDAVLAEPEPRREHRFAHAMWQAARAVAYGARGEVEAARAAATAHAAEAGAYGADAYQTYGYPADVLLAIAGRLAAAGVAGAEGRDDAVIAALEAAVALEDGLPYMEPPYWFFPNRQLLGAALLARGRAAAAEAVYRADLERVPLNGWSLSGLAAALDAQGRGEEATTVREQLAQAWQDADVDAGGASIRYF